MAASHLCSGLCMHKHSQISSKFMACSAPTGCGKTVVLELALVKFLRDSRSLPGKPKAVYRKRTCLFLSELVQILS